MENALFASTTAQIDANKRASPTRLNAAPASAKGV
jgi:hypothetical protein